MKVISLNTWGGRAGLDSLLAFFKAHNDVDIFCLQEVWNGGEHMLAETAGGSSLANAQPQLLSALAGALPNHVAFFKPHFYDFYGLAMLVKKEVRVIEEGEVFVYKEKGYISEVDMGNHSRNIQFVTVETPVGVRTVINFHGLWNGQGKSDTPDRLAQSDNIISFLKTLQNPFVIAGDFNLLPHTDSLKKLENFGLQNLIKLHGVTSTRTSHYKKEHACADYLLVSPSIAVHEFAILPEEVSDHAPLYMAFE